MSLLKSIIPKRTILYYPTIDVPTDDWLRQSLLYWDEIGSIVPRDYEGATLIPYSADIEYLQGEGEFRPFDPAILAYNWRATQELREELETIIDSTGFQAILPHPSKRSFDAHVHIDKVSDSVLNLLEQRKLAKFDYRSDNRWIKFEPNTALLYMALLAKYLADEDSSATVPGTDQPRYESLIFPVSSPANGRLCLVTKWQNLLPIPREDVPISDIIQFKRKRRVELLRFRQLIDEFQNGLLSCESKSDVKEHVVGYSEKVESSIAELKAVLDDAKLATVFGSVKAIAKASSPALWATTLVMLGHSKNVIDLPVEWSATGIGLSGAIGVAAYYVDQRNQRRASLRNSPFAYLYHAQQEAIIS